MTFRIKMKYRPKKIIKYYLLICLGISILSVFLLSSCMGFGPFANRTSQTGDEGIKTFVVTRGDILQEITTTGSVDTKDSNEYSFQVSGQIISALEKGDSFRKGEILVELDNSEGLSKIEQLEAELHTAEDDIISAKSSLYTARINYQNALNANHFAIQLAEINTQKSEQATASALTSLEIANRSADLAYESASAALENTANIQRLTLASAEAAMTEAERIYEEAKNDPSTTPEKLAQYKYNYETAKRNYESALAQHESSIESVEISKESSEIQSSFSVASAESAYEQSLLSQSTTYWNNLSSLYSAQSQIQLV